MGRNAARWIPRLYDELEIPAIALTPRQAQVVALLADGYELKEVARALGIGYHTTKMHVRDAKGRYGARNIVEMVLLYRGHDPRSLHESHPLPPFV